MSRFSSKGTFGNVAPPSFNTKISSISSSSKLAVPKKVKGYFDDDDDEFPVVTASTQALPDDEVDPLDMFMAGVEEQVQKQEKVASSNPPPEIVSFTDEFDDDEYEEMSGEVLDEQELNYDSDGVPIAGSAPKKKVEPLPPVDHHSIKYERFSKNFYRESPEISSLTESQILKLQSELDISVSGKNSPRLLNEFKQASFPNDLLKEISRLGFETPTAIQSQALPVVLSGRDLIGLAKTGSGKTFAFLWPMIVHILDQPHMELGDGPIGIILAPTRELVTQIHNESKTFTKLFNIRATAIIGGAGKWEMIKALKECPEMVMATPGRLIELIRCKATNLRRCTMVVLDEADRMFEMGFEYQMRSIVNNIRPDRQTLLFSATMKKKVEGFAREILTDPIRIVVGTIGQANPDIQQVVEVLHDDASRWKWLAQRTDEFVAEGKVIIFVSGKTTTEEIAKQLRMHFSARQLDIQISCLHGDLDQTDRTNVMRGFAGKSGTTSILVATDIAARGLDVKGIRTVINYDAPKNIETYVHRIGRTGRMGVEGIVPGTAYTLLTHRNGSFAVDLVNNLRLSNQLVSAQLLRLAEADPKSKLIKSYNNSSGHKSSAGSSSGIGIGFNGRGGKPVAMTSQMMASNSNHPPNKYNNSGESRKQELGEDVGSNPTPGLPGHATLIGNTSGNKYIEGQSMGRGKHLTQPSWAASATLASTSETSKEFREVNLTSSSSTDSQAILNSLAAESGKTTAEAVRKRPSRFSSQPTETAHSLSSAPTAATTPVLKGFVKSSASYASVAVNSSVSSTVVPTRISEEIQTKKSRWN